MGKRISNKVYRDAAGNETRAPTGATTHVVIKFGNGQDVVIALDDLTNDIVTISAAHGIAQKVGDNFAEADGDIDLACGLAQAMADRLLAGEWNIRGEGGAGVTILAQALSKATGATLAQAIAKVGDMTKEEKAELRKHPQIAAIITRMEAEKAEAKLARAQALAEGCDIPLPL